MKSNKNEFLKLLTAYQGIIHKVNRIYFRSEADREDNFQETVYQPVSYTHLDVYKRQGEELPRESFEWYLDVLREEVLNSVARLDERRGIIHIRRHLAATPLFKGIPNFRETRIAMLRTESVEELFRIFDGLTTE